MLGGLNVVVQPSPFFTDFPNGSLELVSGLHGHPRNLTDEKVNEK